MKAYSKAQLKTMRSFTSKQPSAMNPVQNMEVLSAGGNVIKFLASAPGSVGFTADGITFHYTAQSHMTHTMAANPIVDLNHHVDEVIGSILESESDHEGNLIVTTNILPKYDFFVPAIRENRYDGISIETIVTEGYWMDEENVLVTSYILTGIAVLITKPPACPSDVCNVISTATVAQHGDVHDLLTKIDTMDAEHLLESYQNILAEIESRKTAATPAEPATEPPAGSASAPATVAPTGGASVASATVQGE